MVCHDSQHAIRGIEKLDVTEVSGSSLDNRGYRVGKLGRGGTDDELEKPLNPV
jgi:hypothetical protein